MHDIPCNNLNCSFCAILAMNTTFTPNTAPKQSHSQRKRALRVRRKREAQVRARLNQDERSAAAWGRLEKLLK